MGMGTPFIIFSSPVHIFLFTSNFSPYGQKPGGFIRLTITTYTHTWFLKSPWFRRLWSWRFVSTVCLQMARNVHAYMYSAWGGFEAWSAHGDGGVWIYTDWYTSRQWNPGVFHCGACLVELKSLEWEWERSRRGKWIRWMELFEQWNGIFVCLFLFLSYSWLTLPALPFLSCDVREERGVSFSTLYHGGNIPLWSWTSYCANVDLSYRYLDRRWYM